MGKSTPPAPDYTSAANAQAQGSKEITNIQTWANRPTMNTPWGTSTWDAAKKIDPATGQPVTSWTNSVSLSGPQQQALDAQQGMQTQRSLFANNLLGNVQSDFAPENQTDWSKFQDLANAPQAGGLNAPGQVSPTGQQLSLSAEGLPGIDPTSKYYQNAGDAIYNQFSKRNEPIFAKQTDDLRSRLYAQGLRDNDAAFMNQMNNLGTQQNDARQQAAYGATIGSGAEAQRMQGMDTSARGQLFGERQAQGNFYNTGANSLFGQQLQAGNQAFGQNQAANQQNFAQQMQAAQYAANLRQQQIQEASTRQNQNLNAMNALLTGQQVQNPQFQSFAQAQRSETPQYMQAAQNQYQSALDAYNAQNAGFNSLLGGLGSLAGGVAGFF